MQASLPYSALLLPDRAIATDQSKHFVWVMTQEQKVEYRSIELGAHIGTSRVISSGLKPEEWVVIEGLAKLMPSSSVNPERITLVAEKGAM